jgi:hypothetical protein
VVLITVVPASELFPRPFLKVLLRLLDLFLDLNIGLLNHEVIREVDLGSVRALLLPRGLIHNLLTGPENIRDLGLELELTKGLFVDIHLQVVS